MRKKKKESFISNRHNVCKLVTYILNNMDVDDNHLNEVFGVTDEELFKLRKHMNWFILWYDDFDKKPEDIEYDQNKLFFTAPLDTQVDIIHYMVKTGVRDTYYMFKINETALRNIENGSAWKLANAIYSLFDTRVKLVEEDEVR